MKGLIFTEFLEMVEEKFSPNMVDSILEKTALPSKGAYTSLGNYEPKEMLDLLTTLEGEVHIPTHELLKSFGRYLFTCFYRDFPDLFEGHNTAFEFLHNVEYIIHVEVRKLYPSAELPQFFYQYPDESTLVMTYQSERPLADLAEGLIQGCISHFKESIEIKRENLNENCTHTRFTLTKQMGDL